MNCALKGEQDLTGKGEKEDKAAPTPSLLPLPLLDLREPGSAPGALCSLEDRELSGWPGKKAEGAPSLPSWSIYQPHK